MNDVFITGIGQVPVREHWSASLRRLAAWATLGAGRDRCPMPTSRPASALKTGTSLNCTTPSASCPPFRWRRVVLLLGAAASGRLRRALDGRLPICTMGGLKARGHPVGATGLYQVVETVQQLRGEAGANQLSSPRWGTAQNIGGSGASVVTHILHAPA